MVSTFAVLGFADPGPSIIKGLLDHKGPGAVRTVKLITRCPGSTERYTPNHHPPHSEWISQFLRSTDINLTGAFDGVANAMHTGEVTPTDSVFRCIMVDFAEEGALTGALKGVDVVFNTFNAVQSLREGLGQAAKAADVKLFVPNWGKYDANRQLLLESLKQINLPHVEIFTGILTDLFLTPDYGWKLDEGKVTVIDGQGDIKFSFTDGTDLGRYFAYVFTHTPPSDLNGKTLRIEGGRTTFNEIIADYKRRETGKPLEIRNISENESRHWPFHGISQLHKLITHIGTVGGPLDNHRYPDWNPKSVLDVIAPREGPRELASPANHDSDGPSNPSEPSG